VIRLAASLESAFIPRRNYPIPARYSLHLCSVTGTRRDETSRRQWGGRACIGRGDNGVPRRGIFDAVETITGLSGIVDHAPVFPEVRVVCRQEGLYGAYLTSHSVRRRWLTTSRSQLTPLWRPTVLVSDRYFTGRPRGAQLAITSLKKSHERERRRE